MPPRDPNKIQLDFPQLTADLIDQLNLIGTVGLLDFAPTVLPVFIIGDRDLSVDAVQPVFTSANISGGTASNPAINTIITDTGPLPAGDYDLFGEISYAGSGSLGGTVELQHRNAANAANLAIVSRVAAMAGIGVLGFSRLPLIGYRIAANERFRIQNVVGAIAGTVSGLIAARLRPIP